MTKRILDVQELINSQKLSARQKAAIFLCFLVVAIDGFDTAAIGFIGPSLVAEWGATPADLAPLFASGLFGLMAGAFIFGPLADRFGRKTVLIATTLFFGIATGASAFAPDIQTLMILRFITGLGLGGAMPSAIALTAELCPEHRRSSLVTLMFCGFTVGSASAGLAASSIVSVFGWQGLLVLGGVLPVLVVPALIVFLPESPRYMAIRGVATAKISATLARILPDADVSADAFRRPVKPVGSPVSQLFKDGYATGTILLWIVFFMTLLTYYLLASWMPVLITSAGISFERTSLMVSLLAAGGTVGSIIIGRLMDRFDPNYVLTGIYIYSGLCIFTLGAVGTNEAILPFAIFAAGLGASGAPVGMNALAANFYPTSNRATGVSWANAVGRSGSIFGSMVGGVLMAAGWQFATIFAVAAIPAFVAATAVFVKGHVARTHAR